MKILGYEIGFKSRPEPAPIEEAGDMSVNMPDGIHKAYIPEFLYKPPFGYPRKENLPLIRQLAKNPYVYGVVKTLCDEAASTPYNVVYKEGVEATTALDNTRNDILKFFDNPNGNKESFEAIIRAVVRDIVELDSGVIIKVRNRAGQLVELFARDGASFLKNPDMYGYLGNRAEYIKPADINYLTTPNSSDYAATMNHYTTLYRETAAYFQYGFTAAALPVPFGRGEVIFLMQNPRSDSVYGRSPIELLADIITTLVFGSSYTLDFYLNNNMPEGIISLQGADADSITGFRERFDNQFRTKDSNTGFERKVGFKYPIVNQKAEFTHFQLEPGLMRILEEQAWFTKIVWSCFGITPDDMGFTENSNKAVSQTQNVVYKRKAVRPILKLLKYHIDKEIISEWGEEVFNSLEWKWDDYDLDEDIKKHGLYETQLRIGIKTPEMIAEEEGIDFSRVKTFNEEKQKADINKLKLETGLRITNEEKVDEELKAETYENELEKELDLLMKKKAKELDKAFDLLKSGGLNNVR